MATFPLRAVGHHDRLTLAEVPGELRTRLVVCAVALTVLFAGCLWQSRALLDVLNRPLASVSTVSGTLAERTAQAPVRAALARSGQAFEQLSRSTTLSGADKRRYAVVALAALAAALPGTDPVTTLLELVPLLALYELSIVMLRISERRRTSVPE